MFSPNRNNSNAGGRGMENKQVFVLEIFNEEEGTWQGRLRWIEGHKERAFRSVLEMLHLIDSVIEKGSDEDFDKAEVPFMSASWDAK